MHQWKCVHRVRGACSDITTSNTGAEHGALAELENLLGRELLYFACRHHLLEIVPKTIFDQLVEKSSSPSIGKLCEAFQEQ